MARHVRHRRPPRSRPARRAPTPASGWPPRCATAGPTARRRGRFGPVDARPHAAWRSSTSPAATSRSAPRTARHRAIVNGEIYNHARAARGARGARATASPPAPTARSSSTRYEEHGDDCVRRLNGIFGVRHLGRARGSGSWPRATRSASSRCTGGATAAGWRSPPRSARCWPPGSSSRASTASRSTTTSPAASCPRRARSSRACRSCRRRRSSSPSEAARRASSSYRTAPGAPLVGLERRRARARARRAASPPRSSAR